MIHKIRFSWQQTASCNPQLSLVFFRLRTSNEWSRIKHLVVRHRNDLHFLSTLSVKVRPFGLEMFMGYVRLTVWLDAVHDEGLKNLLMAWYYAGYYTGLNEGKQQGAAGKDEPTNK